MVAVRLQAHQPEPQVGGGVADEVHEGAYPTPETVVNAAPEVVAEFREWLDGQL